MLNVSHDPRRVKTFDAPLYHMLYGVVPIGPIGGGGTQNLDPRPPPLVRGSISSATKSILQLNSSIWRILHPVEGSYFDYDVSIGGSTSQVMTPAHPHVLHLAPPVANTAPLAIVASATSNTRNIDASPSRRRAVAFLDPYEQPWLS